MRILVLGGDGYLGWPTALRFSARGHEVVIVDSFARGRCQLERATDSLTPIATLPDRLDAWREISGREILAHVGDVQDGDFVERVVGDFLTEAVVQCAGHR